MLTGFYHRSVLRCGCLAERKSGVTGILSATRRREKICVDLSRIGYPRQPGVRHSQSIQAAEKLATCHSEGLGLPEESAFSLVWRRKADPSLRSG
jgi:hypothetical protein